MKTASVAPRLIASMPTAPVPAKTSRKREPLTVGPSTLKRISRRRSLVGRRALPLRDLRMRLRYLPAMMRIKFGMYDANPKEKEFNTENTEVGAQRPQRGSCARDIGASRLSPGGSGAAILRGGRGRCGLGRAFAMECRRWRRLRGGLVPGVLCRGGGWRCETRRGRVCGG